MMEQRSSSIVADEGARVQSPVHRARLRGARRARRRTARRDRGRRSGRPPEVAPRPGCSARSSARASSSRCPATPAIGSAPRIVTLAPAFGRPAVLVALARPRLVELAARSARRPVCPSPTASSSTTSTRSTRRNPVGVRDWTGTRFPIHAVSSGLGPAGASCTRPTSTPSWREPLERYTRDDRRRSGGAPRAVRRVQLDGYAWTRDEYRRRDRSVAAALADEDGEVVAAVHLHGPSYRFPAPGAERRGGCVRRGVGRPDLGQPAPGRRGPDRPLTPADPPLAPARQARQRPVTRRISAEMAGTTAWRSPITAYDARLMIGASRSVLTTRIALAALQPTMCWIAPLIPQAMYRSGAIRVPVWPTCSRGVASRRSSRPARRRRQPRAARPAPRASRSPRCCRPRDHRRRRPVHRRARSRRPRARRGRPPGSGGPRRRRRD